jgi:hypothetical protein
MKMIPETVMINSECLNGVDSVVDDGSSDVSVSDVELV